MQEVVVVVSDFLKFVGGGTALLLVTAWLIRSVIQQLLARDIEKYKFNLKLESDREIEILKSSLTKEIEIFKSSLNIDTLTHQIRFSKLHERRILFIEELYHNILELETLVYSLMFYIDDKYESLKENHEELKRRSDELIGQSLKTYSLLQKNAIYLPSKSRTLEKIHDFDKLLFSLSINLHYFSLPEDTKKFIDAFRERQEEFKSQNSIVKKTIESEFRSLLGVAE